MPLLRHAAPQAGAEARAARRRARPAGVPARAPPRSRRGASARSALGERPYATLAAIADRRRSLVLVRVASTALTPTTSARSSAGPVQGDWWRYLAAPFIYPDVGYLFVAACGIAIFGIAVERRLGTLATAILIVACGALGMLAANGIETAIGEHDRRPARRRAATGSRWACSRPGPCCGPAEVRGHPDEDVEVIGAAVAAAVLIMLPLVEDYANVFAGLGGRAGRRRLRPGRRARAARAATRADTGLDRTTSSSRSRPSCTATWSSTAPSATGSCPRSRRPAEEMGDLAAMQIAGDQAALITLLVAAIGAREALEVGTFLGYGAIAIARGLPDDGRLVCLRARRGLRRARAASTCARRGSSSGSSSASGPALESLRAMDERRAVRLRLHRRRQDRVHRLLRGDPARTAARTA